MTQEDVMRLLQAQRDERHSTFDLEPSYPGAIACKPYPMGYQMPAFRKYSTKLFQGGWHLLSNRKIMFERG